MALLDRQCFPKKTGGVLCAINGVSGALPLRLNFRGVVVPLFSMGEFK